MPQAQGVLLKAESLGSARIRIWEISLDKVVYLLE